MDARTCQDGMKLKFNKEHKSENWMEALGSIITFQNSLLTLQHFFFWPIEDSRKAGNTMLHQILRLA